MTTSFASEADFPLSVTLFVLWWNFCSSALQAVKMIPIILAVTTVIYFFTESKKSTSTFFWSVSKILSWVSKFWKTENRKSKNLQLELLTFLIFKNFQKSKIKNVNNFKCKFSMFDFRFFKILNIVRFFWKALEFFWSRIFWFGKKINDRRDSENDWCHFHHFCGTSRRPRSDTRNVGLFFYQIFQERPERDQPQDRSHVLNSLCKISLKKNY